MRPKNLLNRDEKKRILKIPVIIINPLNIKYKDTDILFGNIIINENIFSLKVVCSECRGLNNVRWRAMPFQNSLFKVKTLGFKVNKIVGECIVKKNL